MPLVTLTTRKETPQTLVEGLLDATHSALVAAGVPPTDKFQRVLRLDASDFRADPTYPDLTQPRSVNFVLVEITLSVGRTLRLKRQIAESIVAAAAKLGTSGEDVMVIYNETRWENWSFGGGRFFYT